MNIFEPDRGFENWDREALNGIRSLFETSPSNSPFVRHTYEFEKIPTDEISLTVIWPMNSDMVNLWANYKNHVTSCIYVSIHNTMKGLKISNILALKISTLDRKRIT